MASLPKPAGGTASAPAPPPPDPGGRPAGPGFRRVGDLLHRPAAMSRLEREAVDDVLALARGSDGSAGYLASVRRSTSGRQRNLAVRRTPPGHPDAAALRRLIEDLVRTDGETVLTASGAFSAAEIRAECAKVERDGGRERLCFPVRWPWLTKPGPANPQGVRGLPVYRRPEERGPIERTFTPGAPRDAAPAEREWWQEPDGGDD